MTAQFITPAIVSTDHQSSNGGTGKINRNRVKPIPFSLFISLFRQFLFNIPHHSLEQRFAWETVLIDEY